MIVKTIYANKDCNVGQFLLTFPNVTLHENPSVDSWVCKCAKTDRHTAVWELL